MLVFFRLTSDGNISRQQTMIFTFSLSATPIGSDFDDDDEWEEN